MSATVEEMQTRENSPHAATKTSYLIHAEAPGFPMRTLVLTEIDARKVCAALCDFLDARKPVEGPR